MKPTQRSPIEQKAILASIAREISYEISASWPMDDNPVFVQLADAGDVLRQIDEVDDEDAREDSPVVVSVVPRYRWPGLSRHRPRDEGVPADREPGGAAGGGASAP